MSIHSLCVPIWLISPGNFLVYDLIESTINPKLTWEKYFQLSQFVLADGGMEEGLVLQSERYENIEGLQCGDQVSTEL